ncbi:MAG TPA: insulinase family protein [Vicinamibacterales bacterium]|nr:insulinase family protein [Vicinamibacterales bacterium]
MSRADRPERRRDAGWARRLAACLLAVACAATLVASVHGQTRDAQGDVQGWPSWGPPPPLPAHEVPFPPYEVQHLDNGLQVVVVQHHEQPVVSMRLIVRAGSAEEPRDQLGLANLEANLLDQGTTTRTAEQIANAIDSIGGGLDTGAGVDLTYGSVLVMRDSFDVGLRLLSDVIRHPSFAQSEIDRQKAQLLAGLRVSDDDPAYIADAVFDRLVYGFHPYGMPQEGVPRTIAGVTRADLEAFHDAYFAPNNSILAIVGDVTPDEAFAEARAVFGDWARHDVPEAHFPKPPSPTQHVVVINKPDAVQTEIRVGNLGVPRKTDDYMALNLAIRILGGEGSDRLQQVLRTEHGLTYAADAALDTYALSGDIEAQTSTRSAATAEVVRLIVNEFFRLQQEPVSERELQSAKDYMTGSFPLTIETPEQIALQVLNVLFYDLPLRQLQTFRQRVEVVTPADVQRVARYYLRPDNLSVVLVGNAAVFKDDLKSAGFGHYDLIDLPDLDLAAPDLKRAPPGAAPAPRPAVRLVSATAADLARTERPGRHADGIGPPRVTPTPAEQNRGQAIIAQAVRAKGGLAVLQHVRTVVAAATTTVMTPQGPVATDTTTYIRYPDRFRVEAHLPGGEVVQVYDAGHAWMKGPDGVHDAPDAVTRGFHDSVRHDLIRLLVGAASGRLLARGLPDVTGADGRRQHVVELSSPTLGPVTLYVDARTGLVTQQRYVGDGLPGGALTIESFSDYRTVDGVKVAFKASVRRGSITVVERTVTRIQYNVPVDDALFRKPAG